MTSEDIKHKLIIIILVWRGEIRKGGGGYCRSVIVQFHTLDTKASRVGASTTSTGNEFQLSPVYPHATTDPTNGTKGWGGGGGDK